jgi:hypothetical protein
MTVGRHLAVHEIEQIENERRVCGLSGLSANPTAIETATPSNVNYLRENICKKTKFLTLPVGPALGPLANHDSAATGDAATHFARAIPTACSPREARKTAGNRADFRPQRRDSFRRRHGIARGRAALPQPSVAASSSARQLTAHRRLVQTKRHGPSSSEKNPLCADQEFHAWF